MLRPPKSQNESGSENGSQNIASDKQKIKILKQAVLDLREEKSKLEKTNIQLQDQIDLIQRERHEIEETYKSEIEDLKSQIRFMQQPINGNIKNNNYNDQDGQIYKKQINQLQQELKTIQDNNQAQIKILQDTYKQLEKDYNFKEQQISKLIKDIDQKNQQNNQLKKNIEDIERDLYNKIKEQTSLNMQLQLKLKTIEKEIDSKDDEIRQLHRGLDDSRFNIVQLQSEIEETRGKFLQYKLILHNQFLDIECLFILRQNIFNEFIFELETPAQKFCYKVQEITDLKAKDEKSFSVTIKSRNREELFIVNQNQDIKKICKSIKNFLIKAQQLTLQNSQISQISNQQNSSLLGGLLSIFGSNNSQKNLNNENTQKQK